MLARGTKIFVAPGEHSFSFFQVKMFTGRVSVLLTSTSLKIMHKRACLQGEAKGPHSRSFIIEVTLEEYS